MRKLACFALGVLLSACGGSGVSSAPLDAANPGLGGPDANFLAPGCDHAAALCATLADCAPFLLKAIYGDVATCGDRLGRLCNEEAASSGSGMTQTNILACEASLKTASCNDVFANNLPMCTFHGSLDDGQPCGSNSQCSSGLCQLGGQLCGVCASKGGAGAACPSGSNDDCQSGLVCTSNKTCVAPALVGTACDDKTKPCLTNLFCTSAKTCGLTVQAGDECPGAYLNLADGTVCSAKSTTTSPQVSTPIATAAVGEICGLAPGTGSGPTLCAPGGVAACIGIAGSIQLFGVPTRGRCAATVQDNRTCTAADICQAGAQCINGTCQIPSGRYCP